MNSVRSFFSSLQTYLAWLPDWAVSLVLIVAAVLLAWWLHAFVFGALERWVSDQGLFRRALVSRSKGPSRLGALMLAIAFTVWLAPLSNDQVAAVQQIMIVGIVILVGWILNTALHVWMIVYLRRFKLESEDNLLARKHVTQSRVLERVARVLIVLLTLGAALMTFDSVRQYGLGLFASAGVAGVIVGLAFQPVLKNLIAGVQLALRLSPE